MRLKDDPTLVSFDWAMKSILRDKANFDVLEGFLCALLEDDIKIQDILESEGNQDSVFDKFNRVDLLVEDSQGAAIIIEVQYTYSNNYLHHILFGTAKLITDHMAVDEPYNQIQKIISITLLYFPFSEEEQADDYIYHGKSNFSGLHTGKQQTKESQKRSRIGHRCNIFPEYYLIEIERFPDKVRNTLDEWIYFFKHAKIPDNFRAKNIQMAREKLKVVEMRKVEYRAYEKFLINRAKYQDDMRSAREEGMEEGREAAHREKMYQQIARRMLENGEPLDKITLYTGLCEDEITQL